MAAPIMEIFGLGRVLALSVVVLIMVLIAAAIFWFFYSAPPHTITITSGAKDSSFYGYAEKYRATLASNGVTLVNLPSQGSEENLKRLCDPSFHVGIGFVQGGVTNVPGYEKLVSLGSITYEPLLIFYRSAAPVSLLSGFAGKRLAIGAPGSGTRDLALQLLALNGIKPGGDTARLVDLDGETAAQALLAGKVDAVFLMSDTTSRDTMHQLLLSPDIRLFDFVQADGYTRRITYLNKLVLPQGSIDFGKNIPPHDINLIGPTVELLARAKLNPAISDLLLEAAQHAHSNAGMFKRQNEFPAAIEHDFPISRDAARYYKSGKTFLYGYLGFQLASLVDRIAVSFVPLIVVLIPAVKLIPAIFKWRMRMRINRWYRELLALEKSLPGADAPQLREEWAKKLLQIEEQVNRMKVPASYADQFYGLRGDIQFVRGRLPAPPARKQG